MPLDELLLEVGRVENRRTSRSGTEQLRLYPHSLMNRIDFAEYSGPMRAQQSHARGEPHVDQFSEREYKACPVVCSRLFRSAPRVRYQLELRDHLPPPPQW